MTDDERPALPGFVSWPIFPFEGDLRVRERVPARSDEAPRDGEPGGRPCAACAAPDSDYLWVDEHWRVMPPTRPSGAPVQVFLETRAHVDLDGLDDELAGELGRMMVRIDRAIQAVGGIGRVHVNRWGDAGSHFHLWCYGRPLGDQQMLGFCAPLWAMTLPPTPAEEWDRNLAVVAAELAKDGGTPMR